MQIQNISRYGFATTAGDVAPGATIDCPEAEARGFIARGKAVAAPSPVASVAPTAAPLTTDTAPAVVPAKKGKR